jgi:hypothetical protein
MYSFFVLGLIPGTSIQITFLIWFDSVLLLIELVSLVWLYHRHPLLHGHKIITRALYRLIERMSSWSDTISIQFEQTSTDD